MSTEEREGGRAEGFLGPDETRDLLETIPGALGLVRDGRLVYGNAGLAELLGVAPEAVRGRAFLDFLRPGDRNRFAARMARRGAGNAETERYDAVLLRPDGAEVPVEIRVRRVRVGAEPGCVFTARDAATERGNALLAARGGGPLRAGEDDPARLEEKLRHLEKIEAVGMLAGGVVHDFNNQLGAILGYADMLRQIGMESAHRQYAEMIFRAARRSSRITEQLLAFIRKRDSIMEPVNLHEAMREIHLLLEHTLGRRIHLELALEARRSMVLCDTGQIENALINLAINGRDAMPSGGTLTLRTDNAVLDAEACARSPFDLDPGDYIRVSVSDTGSGMDAETRAHAFEAFFTTKKPGEGTGMGLFSVERVARNHGGAVTLESRSGAGTTVTLLFPLLDADATASEAEPATLRRARRGGRVLVVEDEELMRCVTRDILVNLGYEVITAEDGREALATYRAEGERIDLVLLDMVMPNMDGAATFEALRRVDPEAKVLLASAYSVAGEVEKAIEAGAMGFIAKPFDVKDLAGNVARILGGTETRSESSD